VLADAVMNPVYPAFSDLSPVHGELKLMKAINAPGETPELPLKPTRPIYHFNQNIAPQSNSGTRIVFIQFFPFHA
jgi:hypothetical protein